MIEFFTDIKTAFDGWGVALISSIAALLWGSYKVATRTKVCQKQKAGDNSNQNQQVGKATIKDCNEIIQKQEAGNNSNQSQSA